jgi:hypothetical protein
MTCSAAHPSPSSLPPSPRERLQSFPLDLYEEWYEEWYNDLIVNAPRVRAIDISNFEQECVCALLEDHTIHCWGHEWCGDISYGPYQQNRYNFISDPVSICAVKIDGQIQCVNWQSAQERAEQLNQHAPFSQVLYNASCALKTNGEIVCIDRLPPVSETTGRKIVVEREDYCSLDEQGYATCRDLLTGNVWTSTPNIRFSLIKLVYEGRAYGLDTEGRFYYWSKNPPYTSARLMALIPDDLRAKNVFPKVNNNICFHKMDDTVQCFLFEGAQPTMLNDEMPGINEVFLSVDINGELACGVRYDHSVNCWGRVFSRVFDQFNERLVLTDEIQLNDIIDINLFYDFVCVKSMNGTISCAAYTEGWNPVFGGEPVSKMLYAGENSWCAINLLGEIICSQVEGVIEYDDDFVMSSFQGYNLLDASSNGNGDQVCGVRRDTHTIVCRGEVSWGW